MGNGADAVDDRSTLLDHGRCRSQELFLVIDQALDRRQGRLK